MNFLRADESSTSSSDDRSIKLAGESLGDILCEEGFLAGNFGCCSLLVCGNVDLERLLLSASMSRNDAAIAALSSGSVSSDGGRALVEAAELPPLVRWVDDEE